MSFPFPGKGFVAEASNQTKPRWSGKHSDVLPLFIPLEDLPRRRIELPVDAAVLLDAPHTVLCLYHIWYVKAVRAATCLLISLSFPAGLVKRLLHG